MPVTLNIIESTTTLGLEVVEVVLASASEPGPAGPGVPVGGTDGQVLTKASATDYDTAWEDPTGGGGGGAPTDADYLVGTANGSLSAEIVVGTTPGGELGGTWASPTVDATHSGSSHAAVQAAAEATAAAALASHAGAADPHTGYRLESVAITAADVAADVATQAELDAHINDAADAHDASAISILDAGNDFTATDVEGALAELQADHEADSTALSDHLADATGAHAGTAVSVDSTNLSGTSITVQGSLEELDNLLDDHSARHEDGGADEISIQGLAGTPTELTNHLSDAADAHDASAISVLDSGANYTATDVEGVLAEIAPQLGGGAGGVPDLQWETRATNTILGTADKGKAIALTATITQTFEADETLGDGWWVILHNAGTVATVIVTLDPAGTETIDGVTPLKLYAGEARLIYCNGSGGNFNSVPLVSGLVRAGYDEVVVKEADQSFSSDTTVTLDDELFFTTVSGASYEIELVVVYGSPAGAGTPDLKFAVGEDGTLRGMGIVYSFNATGTVQVASVTFDTDVAVAVGTDTPDRSFKVTGITWPSGGGTWGFLWSQNTSNPNATIVRAGSLLRWRRIA